MKERCDFCGEVKDNVVITRYGTTHYNRLICQECIEAQNNWNKTMFGWQRVINSDGTLNSGE